VGSDKQLSLLLPLQPQAVLLLHVLQGCTTVDTSLLDIYLVFKATLAAMCLDFDEEGGWTFAWIPKPLWNYMNADIGNHRRSARPETLATLAAEAQLFFFLDCLLSSISARKLA